MINNRQGGRRRGRGGQRGQSLGGQPGNRQDNRQRGNAAQLLEKYKNMARDAQLAGDRVQTEYYLQFADHYHRVLSESRARFEDQRRSRDDDLDEEDGDEEMMDSDEQSAGDDRSEREERPDRPQRRDRGERPERAERQGRERSRRRNDRDERESDDRGDGDAAHVNGNGSIPLDVLPPAIGAEDGNAGEEAAPRPRRRSRAARPSETDGEVAPAA